jgi:hypothetical protein
MEQELSDQDEPCLATLSLSKELPLPPTPEAKTPSTTEIKMISGNGFLLNTRQLEAEVFSITLDGLDRIIEDRTQEPLPPRD